LAESRNHAKSNAEKNLEIEILKILYKEGFLLMRAIADESLKKYCEERDEKLENDKKNYKGSHCCLSMAYAVDKENSENVSPCFYNPKFRRYYLKATQGLGGGKINFCPYCGTKLPQELSDMWFDILEKEYGLDDPGWPEQEEKIPAEFLTDEWWKKRDL
jgi:hypothetical protein